MPSKSSSRKGTNIIVRLGHTESTYGSDSEIRPKGQPAAEPRELKP